MRSLHTTEELLAGIETAEEIWALMSRLNWLDIPPLSADNSLDPDSVYYHLGEALNATLRLIGVEPRSVRARLYNGESVPDAVEAETK